MKRLFLVGLTLVVWVRGAEPPEKFSAVVSPQDFAEAGLDKLTPEQLKRLDALIENYKSGALAEARRAAAEAVAAKEAAEAQAARANAAIAAAKAEAAKAEAAKAEAVKTTKREGLLARAKGLFATEDKDTILTESTVPGKFRGFEPGHVFLLANGDRWKVTNNDRYFTPPVENPRVLLKPAPLGGCWLVFPDLNVEVRVQYVGGK